MRILTVEQHDKPSIGVVGETLRELGAEIDTMWGLLGDSLPPHHREHDGIIVLGGEMNAMDDRRCPYFPALTRLIRDFAEAGKPVLGICLGAQVIARSFGAELDIGGDLEFGFHTITPTAVAAEDPLLGHLDRPLPLFQWHNDHYVLPRTAVLLATGENYRNQGYRIGRTVYGMQCHFEVTESVVQGWIDDSTDLKKQVPDFQSWLPGQFAAHQEASVAFCRTFTRHWVELA